MVSDGQDRWTREMPGDWDAGRLKRVAQISASNVDKITREGEILVSLCNYTDVYYQEKITSDLEFMKASATPREIRRFALRGGEVLLTKDSETAEDIAVPAYVPEGLDNTLCGYHLYLLRPDPSTVDPRFLFRACSVEPIRDQFVVAANGITRYGLGQADLGDALVPVPPLQIQRKIADFLDDETAKIDDLVAEKGRLLQLLDEKRTALITRAVTKGLEPNVPMKDSGVSWIGTIPAHWEIRRLKHIAPEVTVGVVVNPSSYVADHGEIFFFYGSDVKPGKLTSSSARRISSESNRKLHKSRLEAGDLVLVRVGHPGVAAVVPPALAGSNCASLVIVRRGKSFVSEWLKFAFNSGLGAANVAQAVYGAAQKQFNVSHAMEFLFPFPPVVEQRSISNQLSKYAAKHRSVAAGIKQQVELLREYRTALISAAVTGQLDVREAAA